MDPVHADLSETGICQIRDAEVRERGCEAFHHAKQRPFDLDWTIDKHIHGGENVCILRDGDEYIMFHSPENGIGVKRSSDLRDWKDDGSLIKLGQSEWEWAAGRITAGFVLDCRSIPSVGKYIMFFHGSGPLTETEGDFDKNSSIGIAWSNDLQSWAWPD